MLKTDLYSAIKSEDSEAPGLCHDAHGAGRVAHVVCRPLDLECSYVFNFSQPQRHSAARYKVMR